MRGGKTSYDTSFHLPNHHTSSQIQVLIGRVKKTAMLTFTQINGPNELISEKASFSLTSLKYTSIKSAKFAILPRVTLNLWSSYFHLPGAWTTDIHHNYWMWAKVLDSGWMKLFLAKQLSHKNNLVKSQIYLYWKTSERTDWGAMSTPVRKGENSKGGGISCSLSSLDHCSHSDIKLLWKTQKQAMFQLSPGAIRPNQKFEESKAQKGE